MGISVRFVKGEMYVWGWFGSVGRVYFISLLEFDEEDVSPFGFSGRRVAGPPFDHLRAIL